MPPTVWGAASIVLLVVFAFLADATLRKIAGHRQIWERRRLR